MKKENKQQLSPDAAIWAQNLKRVWLAKKKLLALTQESAAVRLGWTQGAVGQYINGHIPLNTDAKIKFAALLQIDPREIDPNIPIPTQNHSGPLNGVQGPELQQLPVLSWEHATAGGTPAANDLAQSWFIDTDASPRSFGLVISGQSMAAGAIPFAPGSIITVDPELSFEAVKRPIPTFIVAEIPEYGVVLRQISFDGTKPFLTATAPGYPIIPVDENCRILGVVRKITVQLN